MNLLSKASQIERKIKRGFFIFLLYLSMVNLYAKPVATIITPAASLTYKAGDAITFSGSGFDAAEGTLSASSFSWSLWFHHEDHWHDEPPFLRGKDAGKIYI